MAAPPDLKKIASAPQKSGVHEMTLHLSGCYGTIIGAGGIQLSGRRMQQIGLAHALYSDPVILILDEPNSNFDATGTAVLNRAIRQMKAAQKSVLIIAYRPAALEEYNVLLVLDVGRKTTFGRRE